MFQASNPCGLFFLLLQQIIKIVSCISLQSYSKNPITNPQELRFSAPFPGWLLVSRKQCSHMELWILSILSLGTILGFPVFVLLFETVGYPQGYLHCPFVFMDESQNGWSGEFVVVSSALVYPFSSQIPFWNRKTKSMGREGQLVGLIVTRHKTVNSEHRGLGSQDEGSVVRQFSLLCLLSCGSLCYVITATFHLPELYLNPIFVGIPFCSLLSSGIAPFHTWFYSLSEIGKQAR